VETFTVFLLSVVAGARRFAHASLLRADVALQALLGMARFPGDDTIRNLFKRFGQGQCQRFFSGLWDWQLARLPECSGGHSLDLDSTVFEHAQRTFRLGPKRSTACPKERENALGARNRSQIFPRKSHLTTSSYVTFLQRMNRR
jgi:hypothetical protein